MRENARLMMHTAFAIGRESGKYPFYKAESRRPSGVSRAPAGEIYEAARNFRRGAAFSSLRGSSFLIRVRARRVYRDLARCRGNKYGKYARRHARARRPRRDAYLSPQEYRSPFRGRRYYRRQIRRMPVRGFSPREGGEGEAFSF